VGANTNDLQQQYKQITQPNRLFGGRYGAGGGGPSILRDPMAGGQPALAGSLGAPQGLPPGPQPVPQGSNSSGLLQQLLSTINPEGQKSGQQPSKF